MNGNNGGRDHWNFCYSLMLIGGGFKAGHIHGSSDATGAFPASSPLMPGDILSTMYAALLQSLPRLRLVVAKAAADKS